MGWLEYQGSTWKRKRKLWRIKENWASFIVVLELLVFEVVLFPNMDGLVDLAVIDAFLAYHHSKESPVVAVLADVCDTFDRRCEKGSVRVVCCTPVLYVWLVSHLFHHESKKHKKGK